jgi:hypothetical protein
MTCDTFRLPFLRPFLLIGLGCGLATAVGAQAVDGRGRTTYEAAFFATFSPSNAYQIVQRVPGFTLETGDTDVRGFGQAAGNVVINGQRPSSKNDTLDTILARIPATRVLRVEIGSGDLFGSEYSGKAQVLNLVLTADAGVAGTIEGRVARAFTGRLLPTASASALIKRGNSAFNLSASLTNDESRSAPEEGFDRLTTPDGKQVEFRRKVNRTREPVKAVSASWEYTGGTNRTAHFNGRFSNDYFSLTQSNQVTPAIGPLRDDRLTQRYLARSYEIGGDVTRPFLGGGLKLVGLATRRNRDRKDVQFNRDLSQKLLGGSAQTLIDQRDERVGRLVWDRDALLGWSIQTGFEAALNKLDSDVDLTALNSAGTPTRIDLPIDQAVVKEVRGEAFFNAGRGIAPGLRTDLGVTYETSKLTVRGDARAERQLSFLKPKATLDWRPAGGWHAQLSVQRTVAQLQFEDFISSAELTNLRVNGGNADLLPQRSWESLLTVDHPLLGNGLAKIELGYTRISLVQDRVPTPEGFDAPGNLGSGEQWIARSKIDAPLGRFGIKGGRLTLYGSYVRTSVQDPYTFRQRPFSGFNSFYFEVNFRQDLGKFAWGFNLSGNTHSTNYRLDEADQNHSRIPYVTTFAEYRPDAKTTLTFNLENATQSPGFRDRKFFTPSRANPVSNLLEHRERNRHILPSIGFKRSFG